MVLRSGKDGFWGRKSVSRLSKLAPPTFWKIVPALEHIKAAYDLGVNAFDTANVYSNGLSEVILGKAIKKYNLPRDEIVVLSKVFFTCARTPNGNAGSTPEEKDKNRYTNQYGLSRKVRHPNSGWIGMVDVPLQHIFESVRHSLERLQLDYIDVLQCKNLFGTLMSLCDNSGTRSSFRPRYAGRGDNASAA